MSPHASSATASEFLPGQLATEIPRPLAALTSMLSVPAPARTISASWPAVSIASARTFVERTTRICGSCSSIAAGRVSGERLGDADDPMPEIREGLDSGGVELVGDQDHGAAWGSVLRERRIRVGSDAIAHRAYSSVVSNRCASRPLRSLGSNQVDLGGMISPASATRSSSAMLVGCRLKAMAQSP